MNAKTWKKAAKQNKKAYRHWFEMSLYYLRNWRDTQKLLLVALDRLGQTDCGCESGGSMGDYDPGFVCSWHRDLIKLEEEIGMYVKR